MVGKEEERKEEEKRRRRRRRRRIDQEKVRIFYDFWYGSLVLYGISMVLGMKLSKDF